MKIWYQSGMSVSTDPELIQYEANLKSYLNNVKRPDTEISVQGVELCSPNLDRYMTEELLHSRQILQNLIKAQRDGYDAFCIGNAYDPAFYALREVADIPVCSLSETSMLLACLLSPNFSILCHDAPLLRRVIALVQRYGLQNRFIECNSFHRPIREILKAFEDPEVFLRPALEVAREAKEKGVCMFINGEGIFNMIIAKHDIRQIEGIPVLEGGGALIKMTEMMVDLKNIGIERSQLGLYTPIPKEDLASMCKLYGIE